MSENDEVIAALPLRHSEDKVAIFSTKGYGKKISQSEIPLQKRAGKGVIAYKPNIVSGYASACQLISDEDMVLLIGDKTSICISATEVPEMGRTAMGNIMMKGNQVLSASKV